ncbi:unnamed protein product [Lactuca virosa]|uniref:Uncharacterized protein n=1 Tax=Lactuca virosa TaxID=75947 RepID=A0AAU9P2B5_9ASTR|nr:unnamed protein product [Lactuca virosa]
MHVDVGSPDKATHFHNSLPLVQPNQTSFTPSLNLNNKILTFLNTLIGLSQPFLGRLARLEDDVAEIKQVVLPPDTYALPQPPAPNYTPPPPPPPPIYPPPHPSLNTPHPLPQNTTDTPTRSTDDPIKGENESKDSSSEEQFGYVSTRTEVVKNSEDEDEESDDYDNNNSGEGL